MHTQSSQSFAQSKEFLDMLDKVRKSQAFISLYTKNYSDDPVCLLQLGIAVALNKTICLLAPIDSVIPDHLIKICKSIEYYDPNLKTSIQDATGRVIEILKREPGFNTEYLI